MADFLEKLEIDRALLERGMFEDLVLKLLRPVKGTYKTSCPIADKTTLELRVDVDGRRPQQRLSGDFFKQVPIFIQPFPVRDLGLARLAPTAIEALAFKLPTVTQYQGSFVVENVTIATEGNELVLTGPIHYYANPTVIDETIEVRIRRVRIFQAPAEALVRIFKAGNLLKSYLNPKTSEYFRAVTLEIDRFAGTSFPPSIDPRIEPCPDGLPASTSTALVFERSDIGLTVAEDDVLSDADSADTGSNWDEGELHDLMETRFDRFGDRQQWNVYGVVVPRFGDPGYDSGYYGVMFDWGGWQVDDTFLRQGAAIAQDAIMGRVSGTLYDTAAKQNRLMLQTFVHEIGHAFNLPHSWSRSDDPDSASNSFMNYPWGYTGGSGGETAFWDDFRWEFDDVELIWMRHGDRKDVIFGGDDWIGDNLSHFVDAPSLEGYRDLQLRLHSPAVRGLAEPVTVEVELHNSSRQSVPVVDRLEPEDGLLRLYIKTPSGKYIRFVPPVHRLKSEGDVVVLEPGESLHNSVLLSYSAKGAHFAEPGEYLIRAYYGDGALSSQPLRVRVGAAYSRASDELAHLMFDGRVAKFLYFGGSERCASRLSALQEAALRHEKTDPQTVRWIHAALGHYFGRTLKCVETTERGRQVKSRRPDLELAEKHLRAALSPLPESRATAFDDIQFAKVSQRLSQVLTRAGRLDEARKVLDVCVAHLDRNRDRGHLRAKIRSDIEELRGK